MPLDAAALLPLPLFLPPLFFLLRAAAAADYDIAVFAAFEALRFACFRHVTRAA